MIWTISIRVHCHLFICLEKNWISYNISSTKTCSDDFPHMIISIQGLDEDECFLNATNHPETKFVFWKDVEFLNGTWAESTCEFFKQCNKTRNLASTQTPGFTYQMGDGMCYYNLPISRSSSILF